MKYKKTKSFKKKQKGERIVPKGGFCKAMKDKTLTIIHKKKELFYEQLNSDKKNELKHSILISYLKSQSIHFLIGEGASSPFIQDLDQVKESIENIYNEEEKELILNRVLRDLFKKHKSVLNHKCTKCPTKEVTRCPSCIPKGYHSTVQGYGCFIEVLEILNKSNEQNKKRRGSIIFSTNYDLFIEQSFQEKKQLQFEDGFGQKVSLNDKKIYHLKNFSKNSSDTNQEERISLIKLHGSLSWKREESQIELKNYAQGQLKSLQPLSDCVIMWPENSTNKNSCVEILYNQLMNLYEESLEGEVTLFVYGYAFLDFSINQVIQEALKNNSKLMIVVFLKHRKEKSQIVKKIPSATRIVFIYANEICNQESTSLNFKEINEVLLEVLKNKNFKKYL